MALTSSSLNAPQANYQWQSTSLSDNASPALRLFVIIPALNEEQTITSVIKGIPRAIPGIASIDIVVVDDGSQDRTMEKALAAGAHVIRHTSTRGVGTAFQSALAFSIEHAADIIVSIDADGQFDPADIPTLLAPVLEGKADFTTASRFKDPTLLPAMPWVKRWGNHLMSFIISRLAGQRLFDVSCGMRCYGRNAALQLNLAAAFTYTQEAILNLAFKQFRIEEIPLRVRGEREFGKSRVANNLWRYGFRTIKIIVRCYRDYHALRLFGGFAILFSCLAAILGGFLFFHYVRTGQFSPYKWTGFGSAAFLSLSLLMAHLGLVGDMLNRQRIYLEEILYRQRLNAQERHTNGRAPARRNGAEV